VAEIAKFSKGRRIIEIPKNQRPIVRTNQKYYVSLRPYMEGK